MSQSRDTVNAVMVPFLGDQYLAHASNRDYPSPLRTDLIY